MGGDKIVVQTLDLSNSFDFIHDQLDEIISRSFGEAAQARKMSGMVGKYGNRK